MKKLMTHVRTTKLNVRYSGYPFKKYVKSPRVEGKEGYVRLIHKDVVIIEIPTDVKRPRISGSSWGSDGEVGITLESDGTGDERELKGMTIITFPEFSGWNYCAGSTDRYAYTVVLTKEMI